jgi:hypothetical protein
LQEVRRHPDPIRFTLLAAYCWRRRQEIVDTLVELLMDVVHHVSTKAERRVEQAFVKDIKKVSGKTNLLFRLAEAVVDKPDGTIREVVFPVVSEQTVESQYVVPPLLDESLRKSYRSRDGYTQADATPRK